MGWGRLFFGFIMTVLVILTLGHTVLHLVTYGSGINGFFQYGVSGLSIAKQIKSYYPNLSNISASMIGIEWFILITILAFTFVKTRMNQNEEDAGVTVNLDKRYKESKTKTDIDILYDLLKERHSIRISLAAKIFKVDKEKIIEWCRILQNANLVTISYPKVGEPEIVLIK